MEEQLLTVISSNALLSVLVTSGLKLRSIVVLAIEPASQSDVPGWWTSQVDWKPSGVVAQGPDVVFPDLTTPAGVIHFFLPSPRQW
jgi:hypothetical protein